MRIGVPKEIKNHEYRVGLTPASVAELVAAGHEVFVETKAGHRHRLAPTAPMRRSARRSSRPRPTCLRKSDMIVKVKEPQAAGNRDARAAAHPVHLSPPRRRQAAGGRADEVRRDLHRL